MPLFSVTRHAYEGLASETNPVTGQFNILLHFFKDASCFLRMDRARDRRSATLRRIPDGMRWWVTSISNHSRLIAISPLAVGILRLLLCNEIIVAKLLLPQIEKSFFDLSTAKRIPRPFPFTSPFILHMHKRV